MSSPVKTDDTVPTPQANADHLYDNLNSPTYEMASEVQETSPMLDDPEVKERQMQEWRVELEKVEQEITTLRQVLGSKVRYASELKRKLGISPLQEMKQDFSEGLKFIKESDTYQRTNQKLHELNDRIASSKVYQKTSAAAKSAVEKTSNVASSIGASVSRKLGDIRNSDTFKSLEVKVESTYASVKAKVTGSKSETSFEEALQSETNRVNAGNDAASKEMTSKLPEEKVPL
ncbi:hypothetical protein CHS0354_025715 [Potamilus streckersoni]|uniref:Tumor protein D54 n=1 Tax=Potamilus streckersoni TaxID=2493646 RepID=A0AAE0VM06_9BIVA|nr:hypothetical protein CHS0354_025715 [Potamilus streckersoni]